MPASANGENLPQSSPPFSPNRPAIRLIGGITIDALTMSRGYAVNRAWESAVRLMVGAYYLEVARMSSGFPSKTIGCPSESSDILPGPTMARTQRAVKYLNQAVKDAGDPSVPEICRRAKAAGFELAVGTARDILSGKSETPEVNNLEALAAALKRPAPDLIAQYLKHTPAQPPAFEDSDLAELWKLYQQACAAGEKTEADNYIRFIKNALKGLS